MVLRIAPWGLPAIAVGFGAGAALGGWSAGWSAALGVVVVFLNFIAHGLSVARAARVSLTALAGVTMIGFVVRMGIIVAIMWGLNRMSFFSPLAFGLAVVPAMLVLLAFEMRLLAGGLGAELRLPEVDRRVTP
jgi:amino acid transporter